MFIKSCSLKEEFGEFHHMIGKATQRSAGAKSANELFRLDITCKQELIGSGILWKCSSQEFALGATATITTFLSGSGMIPYT